MGAAAGGGGGGALGVEAAALLGVEWSPIYAKLNWNGGRILHFDVYLGLRVGASVESSVIPDGGLVIAPTGSPAIGGRFTLSRAVAVRSAQSVQITLTVSWRGYDGRNLSRSYTTYYTQGGLHEYFYGP